MRPDVKRLRNQDTGCRPMRLRMVSVWTAFLLTYGIACTESANDPQSDTSSSSSSSVAQAAPDAQLTREIIRARSELGRLSGAGVRAVWTREVGDGTDDDERLAIMGFDSRNNEGERSIVSEPSDYAKPLITPSGDRAVFSKLSDDGVYVVDWDGGNERRVASGFGLVVWRDPSNGREWVYVGSEQAGRDPPAYRLITRHLLDDPSTAEQVWDAQPVSGNSFQLSRDARFAGGLFPWPAAGVADLDAGTWRRLGNGCWTALASDDSHLFWFFDGSHRNLTIVDVNRERRWRVTINGAPGVGGFEVYHPKWTNHPRFMVMTGPYTVGPGANKVRAGGRQVEIFLGRFAADFTTVESWVQVTHNDSEEFYPDVWIDPAGPAFVTNSNEVGPKDETSPPAGRATAAGSGRLIVDVEVLDDVQLPTPASIAPYKRAMLAMEYTVVGVVEGAYDGQKLIAAHWVIRDSQVLDTAARPKGERHRLVLEPYDDHPELEGQRLVMETEDFLLTLYYDMGSADAIEVR